MTDKQHRARMVKLGKAAPSSGKHSRSGHAISRLRPDPVHILQQAIGNQGMLQRLEAGLRINDVNDPLEREADCAADAAMSSANSPSISASPKVHVHARTAIQRKCDACTEEDEQVPVQRKESETTAVSPQASQAVGKVLGSSGQPLDGGTRTLMESRFGEDFGHVRVHTGSAAAESAHSVGAVAYTVGRNIVFNNGTYNTGNASGIRLLAHELAHVVQQRSDATGGALLQRQTTEEQRKIEEEQKQALQLRAGSLRPGQVLIVGQPNKSLEQMLADAGLNPATAAPAPAKSAGSFSALTKVDIDRAVQAAQLLDIQNKLAAHGMGLNGPVQAPAAKPSPSALPPAKQVVSPAISPDWGSRYLTSFTAAITADEKLRAELEKLKAQLASTTGQAQFAAGFGLGWSSGAVTSVLDMAYVPFKLYVETAQMNPEELKEAFQKFKVALLKAALFVLSSEPEAVGQISAQMLSAQVQKDIFFSEGRSSLHTPIDVVDGRARINLPSSLADVAQAALAAGAPGDAPLHVYNKGLAMGQALGSALMNVVLLFVGVEELKGLSLGADAIRVIKESAVGKKLSAALEAIPEAQKVIAGAKDAEAAAKTVQTIEKDVPAAAKDIADVLEPTRHPKVGDVNPRRPHGFWTERKEARARPGRNVAPGTLEGLDKPEQVAQPRGKTVTREDQLTGIDPLKRTNAQIARQEFDRNFRAEWADKLGVGKGGVVDHARELQLLDRYPGVYTQDELNAFKNMRGIPAEYNDSLHLGALREERNQLYEALDIILKERGLAPGMAEYNSTVREGVERTVFSLDETYGKYFTDYGKNLKGR